MRTKRVIRRTVRLRLTGLYGLLFVVSGAVLLALASGLTISGSTEQAAAPGRAGPHGQTPVQPGATAHNLPHQPSTTGNPSVSHQLVIASVIALGVMSVASLIFGWVMAGRALRPVRDMTAAAQRISADNLHERLAVSGPADELKDLGDTIDGLLDRLEASFRAQRQFVANASHELRTPLTTMRAAVDVAMAKPGPVPPATAALAGRLRAELDKVDDLLEGLLVLARAQHGALPDGSAFSLADVVSAALAQRAGAIAARALTVQSDVASGAAMVTGSQSLVARLADNLIGNAIVHNEQAGWVAVSVRADATARTARLTLQNGGPELDQHQVAQLGRPFRRLGADRTGSDRGSGLGLSIVAAIADAHGGTMDLRPGVGGGLTVTVVLPLAELPARATEFALAGARR